MCAFSHLPVTAHCCGREGPISTKSTLALWVRVLGGAVRRYRQRPEGLPPRERGAPGGVCLPPLPCTPAFLHPASLQFPRGRVLFSVRVCGHLLLGLWGPGPVSHPGQESAAGSREVKLGWLGLRMGSVHDAPWSSVSPGPSLCPCVGPGQELRPGCQHAGPTCTGPEARPDPGSWRLRSVQGSALSPLSAVSRTPGAPRFGEGQARGS